LKKKLSISTSKRTSFSVDDNSEAFIDTTKQKTPEIIDFKHFCKFYFVFQHPRQLDVATLFVITAFAKYPLVRKLPPNNLASISAIPHFLGLPLIYNQSKFVAEYIRNQTKKGR